MRRILFILLSTFVLSSCVFDKEEDMVIVPEKFFEAEIDPSFDTKNTDDWIILHDVNGNPIEAAQFESGAHLIFDSAREIPESQLGITLLRVTYFNNIPSFKFTSYLGERINTKWKISQGASDENRFGTVIGSFEVYIKGVKFGPSFESQISNRFASSPPQVYQLTDDSFKLQPNNTYSEVDDYFLFVIDDDNIPRYKFLENVDPGEYKVSYRDFSEFDRVVEIDFPSTKNSGLFIQAYEDSQAPEPNEGYYTNYYYNSGLMLAPRTGFKAAYLNRFSTYRTRAYAQYAKYSYHYHALGPAPDNIEFPLNTTTSFHDKSFGNFSFSTDTTFLRRVSTWFFTGTLGTQSTSITWEVYASSGEIRNLAAIPKNLLAQYPYLTTKNMKHEKSRFYTTGDSFETYVGKTFKGLGGDNHFEEISIEVY